MIMFKKLYASKNIDTILGIAALCFIFLLIVCGAFMVQFVVREGVRAFRVPRAPAGQLPVFQIEKIQE